MHKNSCNYKVHDELGMCCEHTHIKPYASSGPTVRQGSEQILELLNGAGI
jgi:hypothetical protein